MNKNCENKCWHSAKFEWIVSSFEFHMRRIFSNWNLLKLKMYVRLCAHAPAHTLLLRVAHSVLTAYELQLFIAQFTQFEMWIETSFEYFDSEYQFFFFFSFFHQILGVTCAKCKLIRHRSCHFLHIGPVATRAHWPHWHILNYVYVRSISVRVRICIRCDENYVEIKFEQRRILSLRSRISRAIDFHSFRRYTR